MKPATLVATLTFFLPCLALADVQCGPFHLAGHTADGAWLTVNGVKTKKQKVVFPVRQGDEENVKMHWIVAATKFQGNYSMDYLSKQGKKTLDVEVVRASRSQIKISGAYDCEKSG